MFHFINFDTVKKKGISKAYFLFELSRAWYGSVNGRAATKNQPLLI
jgi:hypothetical protein